MKGILERLSRFSSLSTERFNPSPSPISSPTSSRCTAPISCATPSNSGLTIEPDLPAIFGNAHQIRQALLHATQYAIDSVLRVGPNREKSIHIEATAPPSDDARVRILDRPLRPGISPIPIAPSIRSPPALPAANPPASASASAPPSSANTAAASPPSTTSPPAPAVILDLPASSECPNRAFCVPLDLLPTVPYLPVSGVDLPAWIHIHAHLPSASPLPQSPQMRVPHPSPAFHAGQGGILRIDSPL